MISQKPIIFLLVILILVLLFSILFAVNSGSKRREGMVQNKVEPLVDNTIIADTFELRIPGVSVDGGGSVNNMYQIGINHINIFDKFLNKIEGGTIIDNNPTHPNRDPVSNILNNDGQYDTNYNLDPTIITVNFTKPVEIGRIHIDWRIIPSKLTPSSPISVSLINNNYPVWNETFTIK
jgi:hypothetical protein